jgi:hypothetical protein
VTTAKLANPFATNDELVREYAASKSEERARARGQLPLQLPVADLSPSGS